jgi:hypothetical protein
MSNETIKPISKFDLILISSNAKVHLIQRGYRCDRNKVAELLKHFDERLPIGSVITTTDRAFKVTTRLEGDLLAFVPHPYDVPELTGT